MHNHFWNQKSQDPCRHNSVKIIGPCQYVYEKSVGPVGALTVGHSLIQLGSGGAVSPSASTGQVSGWGPGDEAPGSSEALADVNSHFKNSNTSSTSLTLGEPHKLKNTLSTLFSKHDSMCHRKTYIGQKIITENPGREFQVFREFQVITMAFLDCSTCINEKLEFVPTMNHRKLIQYFRSHLYAIVSDMAHFLTPFGMKERNGLFRTVFHMY